MEKIKELFRITFKNGEAVKVKTGWSLKKKLLLGGGIVSGLILGIFAYGKNHEETCEEENDFEDEENYVDYSTDETEDVNNVFEEDRIEAQV